MMRTNERARRKRSTGRIHRPHALADLCLVTDDRAVANRRPGIEDGARADGHTRAQAERCGTRAAPWTSAARRGTFPRSTLGSTTQPSPTTVPSSTTTLAPKRTPSPSPTPSPTTRPPASAGGRRAPRSPSAGANPRAVLRHAGPTRLVQRLLESLQHAHDRQAVAAARQRLAARPDAVQEVLA